MKNLESIKTKNYEETLKSDLKNSYNINIKKVEKNTKSTDGNVYMIYTTDNKKYVIKIYSDKQHTESMANLHIYLKEKNIIAPEIIFANGNKKYIEIEPQIYAVMYSFLEGEPISTKFENGKLSKELIISTAKELREFHFLTANTNEYLLEKLPFNNIKLRQSSIHFDLTKDNIFVNRNGEIGFIDFDDAKYGASVCDVAILIGNFFFSKKRGVNITAVQNFIDAYYKEEKVLKKEELPFIKEFAVKWIEYTLESNQFESSTTESFEVKEKLIKEFLKGEEIK